MSRSNCRPQLLYKTLLTQYEGDQSCEEEEPPPREEDNSSHAALLQLLLEQNIESLSSFLSTDNTDAINAALKEGDTALHLAARAGNVAIAQCLCAFGCQLDTFNAEGLAPIHIASRLGHTGVVRCLCLAGCRVELKSRDGIMAEVMSMAHGHDDITDLINSLRNSAYKEDYINQLVPSNVPLPAIKLKLLGFSGVGKTELRRCLSASVLSSLLSLRLPAYSGQENKGESPPKAMDEIELSPASPPTSLTCQPQQNFTQGIEVQQVNMTGCGRFSMWEFSGHPAYYQVYDHFLGSSECVHLVLFPLDRPVAAQLQHCLYWLAFLKARMAPQEPLGIQGRPHRAAKVGLVGTRADLAHCPRNLQGEYQAAHTSNILSKVRAEYGAVFEIHHQVFVVDCTASPSLNIRSLRQYLADVKTAVTKSTPHVTTFLKSVERMVTEWREDMVEFPVVSWTQFVDAVHQRVNPLAGDDHMREVVHQLQLQGQLVYLAASAQDLLILEPDWLTSDQLGNLLHPQSKLRSRLTGCYTVDDFQMRYPYCDALELMQVLEALCLCTQCDNDGDIEYEFPHFNQVETLDGLWDKSDPRYKDAVYAGVKLKTPYKDMKVMAPIYTRIQVQLRRSWQEYPEHDSDLYQWCGGSKFCCGPLEAVISLEECEECVEIKVRGPKNAAYATFFFLEDLLAMIDQVLLEMCPGLLVHKHILSSTQLSAPVSSVVHAWSPSEVFAALLEGGDMATLSNPYSGDQEPFSKLVWLGDKQVADVMLPGPSVSVTRLSTLAIQQLASMLDPTHPRGADWCVLAVRLALQPQLPELETVVAKGSSPTVALLSIWPQVAGDKATIGFLAKQLKEMEREDAVTALTSIAPMYQLTAEPQPLQYSLSQVLSPLPSPQPDTFAAFASCSKKSPSTVVPKKKSSKAEKKLKKQRNKVSDESSFSFDKGTPDPLSSELKAHCSVDSETTRSLFSADDQHEPNGEQNLDEDVPKGRTVSPALFTLDESTPSPTTFSSIPLTSSISESKTTMASSEEVTSSQCSTIGKVAIPDLAFTSVTTKDPISYVLPDVAKEGTESPVSESVQTTSFGVLKKAEAS